MKVHPCDICKQADNHGGAPCPKVRPGQNAVAPRPLSQLAIRIKAIGSDLGDWQENAGMSVERLESFKSRLKDVIMNIDLHIKERS